MAVRKPGRGGVSLVALAIVAAVALLGALVTGYASRTLFDSDQFANRASAALADDAVSAEVARRVTDDLVLRAEGDLVGVQPVIEEAVRAVVGGGAFRSLFRSAVSDVHRAIFEQDQNTFTLTLADIGATVRGALEALAPKVARKLPGSADAAVLESDPPEIVVELVRVADDVKRLELILFALAVISAVAALGLSPDRRLTVLRFGLAVAVCGVLAAIVLGVTHSLLLDEIDESGARDAADGIWDAYLGDLRTALLLLAGAGAVIAAGASSLLRPVDIRAPLRAGWEAIATVPERRRARALRGVLLLAAGILIVVRRDAVARPAAHRRRRLRRLRRRRRADAADDRRPRFDGPANHRPRSPAAPSRSPCWGRWSSSSRRRCSSAAEVSARTRRQPIWAATDPRSSATGPWTRSRSPPPTTRCRRPAIPGWLFAQQEKGIAAAARRRDSRPLDRHPLRHRDRGRRGEDRPLRPLELRARDLRRRDRRGGPRRGAADPRPDRRFAHRRRALDLPLPPLLRAGSDPARQDAASRSATSSPPTPTRSW